MKELKLDLKKPQTDPTRAFSSILEYLEEMSPQHTFEVYFEVSYKWMVDLVNHPRLIDLMRTCDCAIDPRGGSFTYYGITLFYSSIKRGDHSPQNFVTLYKKDNGIPVLLCNNLFKVL